MAVPVDWPQISVTMVKTAITKRATDSKVGGLPWFLFDLTKYLTEGSSVTTQKSINNPNGNFTLHLDNQLVKEWGLSLYEVIEPMDAIEIRMSRVGKPELVMRGMVTDTSLEESLWEGGKPARKVTVRGGDYGNIWRMVQIHFLKGTDISQYLLQISGQGLKEKVPYTVLTSGQFVQYLNDMVVNKFIERLDNPLFIPMSVDSSGADPSDAVYPQGVQVNPQGTLWSQLQLHGNLGPFYECFIDDTESATTLVYRKPAYKQLDAAGNGAYIFPTTSAESITIIPEDVIALTRARSEHDVSNWYFVQRGRGDWLPSINNKINSIIGDGSFLSKATYDNCAEILFGFRALEVDTNHGSMLVPMISGAKEPEHIASSDENVSYMKKQIKYLQDCNVDNVMFESGSLRCKGNAVYRPGRYAEIQWRNGVKFTGYVNTVTHVFEPMRSFTTTLQYIRGTEFFSKTAAANAYFRGKGVYER